MMMMTMKIIMINVTDGDDDDDDDAVDRFLVSFMVDARGGVMIGRRHSALRFVIPPSATSHPTRVQCKLVSTSKLSCAPPLCEADALAARVLDFGQTRVKFDRSVHFTITHHSLSLSLSGRLNTHDRRMTGSCGHVEHLQ